GRGRACQEIALPAKEKRRKRSRNPFWETSLTSYWRILLFSECASSIPILKSLRLRKNKGASLNAPCFHCGQAWQLLRIGAMVGQLIAKVKSEFRVQRTLFLSLDLGTKFLRVS